MKRILLALAVAANALPSVAADVGVSVSISEPGFYGRIDIGQAPVTPVLLYPQPVIIAPTPVAVYQQPIYLRVPPGHSKNWRRYCGRYGACGQPVYFVQENWYREHYYRRDRDRDWDDRRGKGRDGDDRRGKGRGKDDDRGRGKGRGRD